MAKILMSLIFLLIYINISTGILDYVKEYEEINLRLRSLTFSNENIRSHISFYAFNKQFIIILKELEYPPGLHYNFKLLNSDNNDISKLYIPKIRYYEAYFPEFDYSIGSFTIDSEDNSVMGYFNHKDETYYIENTDDNRTIIYKASDVADISIGNDNNNKFLIPECPMKPNYFDQFIRKKRNNFFDNGIKFLPVKKNRCEIKLVADYEFYKVIGNKNYHKAARHLINVIERVNKLLEQVDFGINSLSEKLVNLGLVIKEIKIYDRPDKSDDEYHFNMEFPKRPNQMFWANDSLESFSRTEDINSSCASVLLTAKYLADDILGLANVAVRGHSVGICSEPKDGIYHNTAVVTVRKKDSLLITRIFDLVFAHEMGHLWGSPHDGENCVAENYSGGRFIMHYSSNTGYDQNNYRFSNCSIDSMWKVLYTVQPICFVEEQKTLCGNGILEPGEECDYGGRYADTETANIHDSCCTNECKLRQGALCSPKHSDCCSETCTYLPSTHVCSRRNNDTCQDDAYCTGKSATCSKPEIVEDGITCNDEGTCLNGTCYSYCEMSNPGSLSCICENLSDACYRCCKDGENGKCKALIPKTPLEEGSICFFGQCKNNACVEQQPDIATHYWNLLKNLNQSSGWIQKLFGEYAVFLVIFASLSIWIPCAYCIHKRDRNKIEQIEKTSSQEVVIVPGRKRIIRQNATVSDITPNAQESTA